MKKKILIIGNDANAYALAKKLSEKHDIYITPSGDTLKDFATCLDIREDSVNELLDFAMENEIDMTIPISQKSLQANIAAKFTENKLQIFGANTDANEIILKKTTAKKILYKLRIPTPKFGIFEKQNLAADYIKNQKFPIVIKNNDSNSAVIVTSAQIAKNIIDYSGIEKNKRIIIEDYIYGTTFSFYAITDGYKALPLGSSITYKHSLDGNGGQLTSGMGACSPNFKLSLDDEYFIMNNVIYPTLDYLDISGNPYLGILGVNGILDDNKNIYILGWNSFMQNCDATAILENIDDDLYDLFESCVIGSFSDEINNINLADKYSMSLVLNCNRRDTKENVIKGLDDLSDDIITTFSPSVKRNKYLELEAEYGQVMTLTSSASTLSKARSSVYSNASIIDFSGLNYRNDICNVIY